MTETLYANVQVFSWEPIRCHDAVDVGWSRLSDLNIHEGKLLGCSYNQSCVGVWVVDISVQLRLLRFFVNVSLHVCKFCLPVLKDIYLFIYL